MYRGRLLTRSVTLPIGYSQSETVKPRVAFFSWNVDGLTDTLLVEIRKYLPENSHISLIMLQETHWSFSGEWSESGWNFVHSASGRKGSGGVLIGLRDETFPSSSIRWGEIVPGHLLHVRCQGMKQQFDLLCVYQYALGLKGEAPADTFKKRARLWNKMDAWLSSVPIRSDLVVAGDLNTAIRPEGRVSGGGILDRELTAEAKNDQELLMRCLSKHRLCVLNSWGKILGTHICASIEQNTN